MDIITEEALAAAKLAESTAGDAPAAADLSKVTIGPEHNDLVSKYSHGSGSWDFAFAGSTSVDILHWFQSRMYQVLKVTKGPALEPLPRAAKDVILRDKYPVKIYGE